MGIGIRYILAVSLLLSASLETAWAARSQDGKPKIVARGRGRSRRARTPRRPLRRTVAPASPAPQTPGAEPSSRVRTLTDGNFKTQVEEASGLVLVKFTAPWCPPCRAMAPIVEAMAGEFEGRVTVGELDVDKNPATAGKFDIMSIPKLLLFRNGTKVAELTGGFPESDVRRWLQEAVDETP